MSGPARIRLLVPGNIQHHSGGNVYNAKLAWHLQQQGVDVDIRVVDGSWPRPAEKDKRRLAAELEQQPSTAVLVDGLIGCGVPDEIRDAEQAGTPVWILLHMVLADHPELDASALPAAGGVICTSTAAARDIRDRYPAVNVTVALPGVDQGDIAGGSVPPRIAAVGALLPNKQQTLLLAALARLQDLEFTAALIGSDVADPDYAAAVRAAVAEQGLSGRVRLTGELKGAALDAQWLSADLSVLVSRTEAFGMVVTESLAHGIPVVVRAGTGAEEALGLAGTESGLPGVAVELEDNPAPLADILRHWLSDPLLRSRWRAAALEARAGLAGWDATAACVLAAMSRSS